MKIEPYKTRLCQGNAYWMAVLCNKAYEDNTKNALAELQSMRGGGGFQNITPFDKKSSQAIFVEHEKYYAIVFRGTDEKWDWVDNIDIRTEDAPMGRFHNGFWDATHDIWDDIEKVYQEARSREKRPLFIAGHSLGGAMATVAAAKLALDDKPFTSVYTFGQPRAMDAAASKVFNNYVGDRYFRFQNNNDIVTRIPSRLRFSHVGKCIYIDADGDIHDDPGFWFRFLDTVEGATDTVMDWKQKGFKLSDAVDGVLRDHKMPNYMNFIRDCDDFPTKQ